MIPLAFALLLALAGIRQDPAPDPAAARAAAQKEERLAAADDLVERLCAAFRSGKLPDLEACIALDPLFERAARGIDAPEEFRKDFFEGVRSGLLSAFLSSVHEPLAQGAELKLLRVRERDGELRPLLRVIPVEGGFSYLELKLCDGARGAPVVCDWLSYAAGEWTSELLRHAYLPHAEKENRGILDRLLGRDQLLTRYWSEVEELVECASKKDFERGLAVCKRMPEELRHDKFVLLQRLLLVAGHTHDPEYMRLLEDLHKYFPNDASSNFHAIDYHYLRGEYQLACDAIGRLRSSLDGDPFLDYLEATILFEMHKESEARRALEKSLAEEPERLKAHWSLVAVLLRQRDHDAVLAELERMDGLFELRWADFSTVEAYKEFAASEQHSRWLAYLAAKK